MLSSSPVLCQSDPVSKSERLYLPNLKFFNNVEELKEVKNLLAWWNQYRNVNFSPVMVKLTFSTPIAFRLIIPNQHVFCHPTSVKSALRLIKARHRQPNSIGPGHVLNYLIYVQVLPTLSKWPCYQLFNICSGSPYFELTGQSCNNNNFSNTFMTLLTNVPGVGNIKSHGHSYHMVGSHGQLVNIASVLHRIASVVASQ